MTGESHDACEYPSHGMITYPCDSPSLRLVGIVEQSGVIRKHLRGELGRYPRDRHPVLGVPAEDLGRGVQQRWAAHCGHLKAHVVHGEGEFDQRGAASRCVPGKAGANYEAGSSVTWPSRPVSGLDTSREVISSRRIGSAVVCSCNSWESCFAKGDTMGTFVVGFAGLS